MMNLITFMTTPWFIAGIPFVLLFTLIFKLLTIKQFLGGMILCTFCVITSNIIIANRAGRLDEAFFGIMYLAIFLIFSASTIVDLIQKEKQEDEQTGIEEHER